MSKYQSTLEEFRAKMIKLNNGLAKLTKERKDRDKGEYNDTKDDKVQNTKGVNQNYFTIASSAINSLGPEDLKIALEELREQAMVKFKEVGEANVKFQMTSMYDYKNYRPRDNQRIGAREAYKMIEQLMHSANDKLITQSGQSVEHKNLLKVEFNQRLAHDQLSERISMTDKVMKKGVPQEVAEKICLVLDESNTVLRGEIIDYSKQYNDSSKALNDAIEGYEVAYDNSKDPHALVFQGIKQPLEAKAQIKSEFAVRRACIKYKEAALLGSKDKKQQAKKSAHVDIAEALKLHPACEEYKTGHAESVKVREKAAKILLDQSMQDGRTSRGLSWIKDAISSIKVSLHLGSKTSREASVVAKDIIASLRKDSVLSTSKVAPGASIARAKTSAKQGGLQL